MKEITDISFEYQRGRTGAGGKWLTIIFTISRNVPTNTQMSLFEAELSEYIDFDKLKAPDENVERLSDQLQSMAVFADELPLKDVKEIYYAMQEHNYDDIFLSFKRIYQAAVNNNPKNLKSYILGIIKKESVTGDE